MFRRLEDTAGMLYPEDVPPLRRAEVRNLELRQKRAAAAERRRLQEQYEAQQAVETP